MTRDWDHPRLPPRPTLPKGFACRHCGSPAAGNPCYLRLRRPREFCEGAFEKSLAVCELELATYLTDTAEDTNPAPPPRAPIRPRRGVIGAMQDFLALAILVFGVAAVVGVAVLGR